MGLRCLLGHNFGEPELERERKEEGNEVVITVREVKTCQRCGEQQIVSENKEVTSIEQLANEAEAAAAEAETAAAEAEAAATEAEEPVQPAEPGAEPPVEEAEPTADAEPLDEEGGAELLDEGPDEAGAAEPGPDLSGVEVDSETSVSDLPEEEPTDEWPEVGREGTEEEATEDSVEDDGIILDEESTEPSERDYGEWPAVEEKSGGDDREGGDISPWPDHRGEDEGFDATVDEDDDEDVGVTFGGGLTPEADGEQTIEDDAEFIESGPSKPARAEESTDETTDRGTGPSDAADRESVSADADAHADAHADADADTDAADQGPASGDAARGRPEPEDTPAENVAAADAAAETGSSDRSSGATSGGPSTGRDFSATEGAELTTSMNEADTEYYCPECGMTRGTDGGSMRAGDICPECKRGYVTERTL